MKINVSFTESDEKIGFTTLDNGQVHSFPSLSLPF